MSKQQWDEIDEIVESMGDTDLSESKRKKQVPLTERWASDKFEPILYDADGKEIK